MSYWLCQVLGWGAWSLINGAMYAAYSGWKGALAIGITSWMGVVGIATSHQLRAWIRSRHWIDLPPLKATPRLVAAAVVFAVITTVINWLAMIWVFRVFRFEESRWQGFISSALIWIAVYLLWAGIYFSVKYFEKYSRSEVLRLQTQKAATEASLRALRAQVNPHFLFNSLNSIRALIIEDPARAQQAVTELSQLLRYSLKSDHSQTVTLGEEMAAVDDYLQLEKIRLEDRLSIEQSIQVDRDTVRLPPMLLQTLVENAIKHGIAKRPTGGLLQVEAEVMPQGVQLTVRNPGTIAVNGHDGIGIRNSQERLRLLYGPAASLTLRQEEDSVVAEVRIPQ